MNEKQKNQNKNNFWIGFRRGAADALHPANHRIWIPDHSNRSKDAERGGKRMAKSHKRKPKEQQLTEEEKQWIQKNVSSGETEDGISWIAIPDRPGEAPFTLDEILEALGAKRETNEAGSKKDVESD